MQRDKTVKDEKETEPKIRIEFSHVHALYWVGKKAKVRVYVNALFAYGYLHSILFKILFKITNTLIKDENSLIEISLEYCFYICQLRIYM